MYRKDIVFYETLQGFLCHEYKKTLNNIYNPILICSMT